jgi:hypothetical protein
VRETTVLEGGVTETKLGSLEGSQAVPLFLLVKDLFNCYLKDVGAAVVGEM